MSAKVTRAVSLLHCALTIAVHLNNLTQNMAAALIDNVTRTSTYASPTLFRRTEPQLASSSFHFPRSTSDTCQACRTSITPFLPSTSPSSLGPTSASAIDLPLLWTPSDERDADLAAVSRMTRGGSGNQSSKSDAPLRSREARGWGTDTVTTVVTVWTTQDQPWVETLQTTYGIPCATSGASVVVVSVYAGPSTTITLTPQIVWQTLYPTTTQYATQTLTEDSTTYAVVTQMHTQYWTSTVDETVTTSAILPTTPPQPPSSSTTTSSSRGSSSGSTSSTSARPSSTTSSTASATATRSPQQLNTCFPGDEDESDGPGLSLDDDRRTTLYVIAIYIVGITVAWNLILVRDFLYGFKCLTAMYHELGHILAYISYGQTILSVNFDPRLGGATFVRPDWVQLPPVLFAGYLFSILIGGAYTLCGFSTYPSKIASIVIGVSLLPLLWLQKQILARLAILGTIGLLVGLWFLEHAKGLRFLVLFVGVMNSWYLLSDTNDDYFHNKRFACCSVMMASHMQGTTGAQWFLFWLILSTVVFAAFVIGGLAAWRQTPHGMYCWGQSWLAT